MIENLSEVVTDLVAYLMLVSREGATPRQAQERLRTLQARHREVELELVWEEEAYDHSLHYDVLLRKAGTGTVSISFAGERGLPWPLRGVKRWSDANLLQVNGKMLTMEEAVTFLDVLWNHAPLMERMVNACLVREELERHPIELEDDELQLGMDGLRRLHKLYTVEDTHRWMQQRGLTHELLEQEVAGTLMCAKLRQRIAEGRVEHYFEAHRSDFDMARVARIECADETAGVRVRRALQAKADYAQLERAGALRIGFERVRRGDVSGSLQQGLVEATPGDVLGPTRRHERFEVTQVLAIDRAELNDEARGTIEHILFDVWLAERRSSARVCWHWGSPDRAPSAA